MKTVQDWFDAYGASHQNPTNIVIHWICVPLIAFSTLGLLWAIPVPGTPSPWVNVATALVALSLLFYARLSLRLAVGIVPWIAVMLAGCWALAAEGTATLVWVSVGVFVASWIAQFVGHKIEGQKPSFFQDLQFLLIGPLWLMGKTFRKLGLSY
jgi:uncharacterized membrane protein YGL010W